MARTLEKVESLVGEDEAMREALETVLERAEDGTVAWADVSDDLTSGQWGRLIQTGLLEDADGEGFDIADPDGVRTALFGDPDVEAGDEDGEEPPGDSSWTTWDKAAGVLALLLFPGYYLNDIRQVVGGAVDVVLGPLDSMLPFYLVILLLAVLTGLYSTILQANLVDTDRIAYYQSKMQDLQDRQEEAKERGDDEELEALREEQMEQMGENLGMFKEQFRPMVWTMILIIPVFLWMYWMLLGGHLGQSSEMNVVLPLIGEVGLLDGAAGPMPAWIVWYFLSSLSFSQIIRKALDVNPTPTTG